MKRFIVLLLFSAVTVFANAQKAIPTRSLTITGNGIKEVTLSFADIQKMPDTLFAAGFKIYAHDGTVKRELPATKGVLLKNILQQIELNPKTPKHVSSYYFLCVASDGYKILYSWNELFNNPTGRTTYILTASNDATNNFKDEQILLVTPNDIATGRRFVKNLQKIIVGYIE